MEVAAAALESAEDGEGLTAREFQVYLEIYLHRESSGVI